MGLSLTKAFSFSTLAQPHGIVCAAGSWVDCKVDSVYLLAGMYNRYIVAGTGVYTLVGFLFMLLCILLTFAFLGG